MDGNGVVRYVSILEAPAPDGTDFKALDWRPWIRCGTDTMEQTAMLAAHRYIRQRGGVAIGEVLDFVVYVRPSMDLPGVVYSYQMRAGEKRQN